MKVILLNPSVLLILAVLYYGVEARKAQKKDFEDLERDCNKYLGTEDLSALQSIAITTTAKDIGSDSDKLGGVLEKFHGLYMTNGDPEELHQTVEKIKVFASEKLKSLSPQNTNKRSSH